MNREGVHHKVFLLGLLIVVIGLPSSKFLMSVGQIVLFANWILQFNFKERVLKFWRNKAAITFASIFLICFIGFAHSEDIHAWYRSMRVMLPVFLMPLFFGTSPPLKKKEFHFLMAIFIATVIFITSLGMCAHLGFLFDKVDDVRSLSLFISHIRLSLMIVISITMMVYYILIFLCANKCTFCL